MDEVATPLFRPRLGHRSARPHLEQIVDDDFVAGIEAGEDRPLLADPVSGRDRPRLDLPIGADNKNKIAFLGLDYGGLRHQKYLVALARSDANDDELSRKKLLARIVEYRRMEIERAWHEHFG